MKNLRWSLGLLGMAAVVGCGGESGSGEGSGTISGQVTDGSAFAPVSGAVVAAFQVEADGSLRAISDEVTTDASGRYELTVRFEGSSISDVLVTAEGNVEAKAIVSGRLRDGGRVTAPPMNDETTVEGDVYVEARAEGSWNSDCTTSGLRSRIDATVAASVRAGASYSTNVSTLARSVVAGMRARGQMLLYTGSGIVRSAYDAALAAEAEAQGELDEALDTADTQAEVEAAIELYFEAVIEGYEEAGITLGQYSQSIQAEASAFVNASVSFSSQILESIRLRLESEKAELIGRANEASMAALGATQTVLDGLESARAQLEASIEASAGVQSQIESAWASYNAYVQAELKTQLESVRSGASGAVDQVQSGIATAQGTLESALTSAGENVEAIVDAYGDFVLAIEASITGNVTLGTLAQAQVEATVRVLLNVNLNG